MYIKYKRINYQKNSHKITNIKFKKGITFNFERGSKLPSNNEKQCHSRILRVNNVELLPLNQKRIIKKNQTKYCDALFSYQ